MLVNANAVFLLAACLLWTWRSLPLTLLGFALPNLAAFLWFGEPDIQEVWRWGAMYSERTFAFATGITRTLNWADFQRALGVAAAYELWKEKQWRMLAWLLLFLAAVAAGWRFFPRYYFQLLPVAVVLAARGYTLFGRWGAIVLGVLLVLLARFRPRYVMLVSGETGWSD